MTITSKSGRPFERSSITRLSLAGPILWVLGWILTTLAYFRAHPGAATIAPVKLEA